MFALLVLRRWMPRSRSLRCLMKWSFENSHLSGSAFLKPCDTSSCVKLVFSGRQGSAGAHVGVQLAHEGREVVVLEVLREQVARELRRLLHHKAAPGGAQVSACTAAR